MELIFENAQQIGTGEMPNLVQFPDTSAELFYTDAGELYGEPILELQGNYSAPALQTANNISPDIGIENIELNVLGGFGIVGSYTVGDIQKLIIYEFAISMDTYLLNGGIKKSIDNAVSQFDVSFSNPLDVASESGANVAISEYESLLSPGAKVTFNFAIGDSDIYEMGIFYVDQSSFTLLSESVSADGRNIIGKALRDQTLDENNDISWGNFGIILENLLEQAQITSDYYLVENSTLNNRFNFDPNTTVLNAIEDMLKLTIDWKIEELTDGTIVIGSPNYAGFENRSTYSFERGTDIFSRSITQDDQSAYRRVCIHDSDWTIKTFAEVENFIGWNLQANKTLYVEVPKGTNQTDVDAYAQEITTRLENVGKVESFTGPFRPQLVCGDGANIVDEKGNHNLGLITEINHTFGKDGFFTNFTVDSGGRLGKGRFSDYIKLLSRDSKSGSVGYDEIV